MSNKKFVVVRYGIIGAINYENMIVKRIKKKSDTYEHDLFTNAGLEWWELIQVTVKLILLTLIVIMSWWN